MEVDENRDIYDHSDHYMVRLSLKVKKNKLTKEGKRGDNREIQTITRKNEQL